MAAEAPLQAAEAPLQAAEAPLQAAEAALAAAYGTPALGAAIPLLLALGTALAADLALGDPRTRFHPTAWAGRLIGLLVPLGRSPGRPRAEMLAGAGAAVAAVAAVSAAVWSFHLLAAASLDAAGLLAAPAAALAAGILLKTTISVRGMERHALAVAAHLEAGRLAQARESLSMIVKRDTSSLDGAHVASAAVESVSENTVDGVTGPLFYFGLLGLFGAFAHRTVSTLDSMAGYRTWMFRDLGRFAAGCDTALNYAPARLTALVMVLAAALLRADWRGACRAVARDRSAPASPNAGYPMAAMAGALAASLEKEGHYTVGAGGAAPDASLIRPSVAIMKATSLLFCCTVTVPAILALSWLGWWQWWARLWWIPHA